MSRFHKGQFFQVIQKIKEMEKNDEDIWVAVGILEYMFDDDCGYIDQYFHSSLSERNDEQLWNKLQDHLQYIEIRDFVSK